MLLLERERRKERERRFRRFHVLLSSAYKPTRQGGYKTINLSSGAATCKHHVIPSKGIGHVDNKNDSSASAKCSALPAEILTFTLNHITDLYTCT